MRAGGLTDESHDSSALNKRVLVLGGTGGTGHLGVQMAKAMGAAHVAATGSDVELLRSLGADQPINYRQVDWTVECADAQFDVVYDTVGGYAA